MTSGGNITGRLDRVPDSELTASAIIRAIDRLKRLTVQLSVLLLRPFTNRFTWFQSISKPHFCHYNFLMTTAAIVAIGNELVRGYRQDRNGQELPSFLSHAGFEVKTLTICSDSETDIRKLLSGLSTDLIILTGGLGTTRDDKTKDVIASILGKPLVEHPDVRRRTTVKLKKIGIVINDRYRNFFMLPKTSLPIPNPSGLAEGFIAAHSRGKKKQSIVVLPGVPSEVRSIVAKTLGPVLSSQFPEIVYDKKVELGLIGMRESVLEDGVLDLKEFAKGQISILPQRSALYLLLPDDKLVPEIETRFPGRIFTKTGETLPQALIRLLSQRSETICTAESCTGGLLSQKLTAVPGSSKVFQGGAVTYSNESKMKLLGVDQGLVKKSGAVSKKAACAMAKCAKRKFRADWAVSITGIAGPGGGTKAKPVGTVFIGLETPSGSLSKKFLFQGLRSDIRENAVNAALGLIIRYFTK